MPSPDAAAGNNANIDSEKNELPAKSFCTVFYGFIVFDCVLRFLERHDTSKVTTKFWICTLLSYCIIFVKSHWSKWKQNFEFGTLLSYCIILVKILWSFELSITYSDFEIFLTTLLRIFDYFYSFWSLFNNESFHDGSKQDKEITGINWW